MIGGIMARPFEPAVHFCALLLRPPDSINSTLITDFVAELYTARNALSANRKRAQLTCSRVALHVSATAHSASAPASAERLPL
ncbi:hypothetical protein [Mesorhizobium sp.]|uniref:hypothetical protein n=1 Tax=Mesorhizobium sp. TaxID=1871066 RepID=UPI000FE645B2|nr:hypothetical protein [Mesorhizobium sp.]RWK12278.1 MAG: hypothetical protein EOR39_05730 [Mesorhizobium sp.]